MGRPDLTATAMTDYDNVEAMDMVWEELTDWQNPALLDEGDIEDRVEIEEIVPVTAKCLKEESTVNSDS